VEPLVRASEHVDGFLSWETLRSRTRAERVRLLADTGADAIVHVSPRPAIASLARSAGIPVRVGTWRRPFHLWTCNVWVNLKRSGSPLHEAQLNLKLLTPFGAEPVVSTAEVIANYGMTRPPRLAESLRSVLSGVRRNVIVHPLSRGSAREWGLENYVELIRLLQSTGRFQVLVTGSAEERARIERALPPQEDGVHLLAGRLTLSELIGLIAAADGLVANSTGPLHVAAALGKTAIGLFAPARPMHPGRWAPLGPGARTIVFDENCGRCSRREPCDCIRRIRPERVLEALRTDLP